MDEVRFTVLNEPLLEQAYALRYDVYRERGYIDANDTNTDHDEYDADSVHVGAVQDGRLIGYVRLILPPKLPVYRHCALYPGYQHLATDLECAEVSRLVVHRSNRVRGVAKGLYKAIVTEGHARGMTRCIAAMEPALAWLIQRAGFHVERIGPEAYYLGTVSPYLLKD